MNNIVQTSKSILVEDNKINSRFQVSDKKENINLKKSFFKKSLQKIKLKKNKLNEYIKTFHFYLNDYTKDCKGTKQLRPLTTEKLRERDEVRKEFDQKTNTVKTINEILKNKFRIHNNIFNYIGRVYSMH